MGSHYWLRHRVGRVGLVPPNNLIFNTTPMGVAWKESTQEGLRPPQYSEAGGAPGSHLPTVGAAETALLALFRLRPSYRHNRVRNAIVVVRLLTTFRPVASPAVIRCWLVLRRTSWNRRRVGQAPARHRYHECICRLSDWWLYGIDWIRTRITRFGVRNAIH